MSQLVTIQKYVDLNCVGRYILIIHIYLIMIKQKSFKKFCENQFICSTLISEHMWNNNNNSK